tara:strand:- start:36 stop:440 length:405 start_codon:yes stop_codon:yes gene_type:complete
MITKIKELEATKINDLNSKGWNLQPSSENFHCYDAYGKDPKGFACYVEMKFRNDFWTTKMLEKDKYDDLMKLTGKKFYYVKDLRGEYLFRLEKIKMPPFVKRNCPNTTLWDKTKRLKLVYLLQERQASKIIRKE